MTKLRELRELRSMTDGWGQYWLPYCFVCLGGRVWLPLNRKYKPLGVTSRDWVDYEDYRPQAVEFSSDPRTFRNVWWNSADDGSMLWLYDDAMPSRADYYQRLSRLLALSHRLTR